ncbi:hypothetical protein ATCC90586_002982 [Pythium insidiosum]|nr:hypothetical protein ATCC90586_002982 [Pythium insidiosum]
MQAPATPTKLQPVGSFVVEPVTPQMAYAVHVDGPSLAVPAVREGGWDTGFFGCFSSMVPNCCMVYCLPCVSLAQISQRIGMAKYSTVLLGLGLLWLVELVFQIMFIPQYRWAYSWDDHYYDDYNSRVGYITVSSSDSVGYTALLAASVSTQLMSLTGLVIILVTWSLRGRIRERFQIPGSCVTDCCASFFCTCCAIAQMATHVKSYKPGSCDFGPVDTLPGYLPN